MRTAITIGYDHEGKAHMVAGPEVPLNAQCDAVAKAAGVGTSPTYAKLAVHFIEEASAIRECKLKPAPEAVAVSKTTTKTGKR